MFTFTPEDGTGLSAANSYCSVTRCDDYHAGHLYASQWESASASNKEKALALASLVIDSQVHFHGAKLKPEQGLQWPRLVCPDPDALSGFMPSNQVPKAVQDAACEMARELLTTDRTTTFAEGISSVGITGAVHVQFNANDRKPILSRLAIALLEKYGRVIGRHSTTRLIRA